MKSTKSEGLEPKKKKTSKIFRTSLTLVLIVFAFTMSSPSSFFLVKPVEAAGTLTSIAIMPSNNIVNTQTIYEIGFKTATTGTIKTIKMTFPSTFDVSDATRYIERSGIGTGSLSIYGQRIEYKVTSPESVDAGTNIRIEIGRIVNANVGSSLFKVEITTNNPQGYIIDGPTLSPSFTLKAIDGNDISPGFMIRKTLQDDLYGHTHGWDPGTIPIHYDYIADDNLKQGDEHTNFVSVFVKQPTGVWEQTCTVIDVGYGYFKIRCTDMPVDGSNLEYIITRLPSHVLGGPSLKSSSLQGHGSNSTQNETTSELP